ncbi:uncharacterized protein [Oryza sativa Japonica Group]|uniref:uncharacterized protein n=1 Tax=Oryza sativa subsp. japonica TaxID=39947 RepID=UPI00339C943B
MESKIWVLMVQLQTEVVQTIMKKDMKKSMTSTLDLMKLKASSGWSDKSFTELLGILKDMLPQENTLPETTYEAKQKEGVETWDAYGQENFTLRVLLFCTINDYPALGNLSGQTVKGKKACSDCMEHTRSRWLKKSRKMVYMGHRRWLPLRHAFRRTKKIFNGKKELGSAPADLSGDQTKDGLNARLDLQEMNIRSELQPVTDEKTGRVYLPPASHTLSKDEKIAMLSCLVDIKVPSGYCARISKYVKLEDLKLVGMKSHDCHVLITQILPVAIRGILPPQVHHMIQRLCAFFNTIGQKIIDPEDLDGLQADIVSTLCHLEMYFPLAFFDIMVHLTVHLVKQTKICGPAFMREMWPFERYIGILKSYVRNRAKPEGSIIEGYMTEEAIEFCIDYMAETDPIGVPSSRHKGRLAGVGTTGRKRIVLDQASYAQAHFAVLQHMAEVTPYFEEHLAKVRQDNIGRSDIWINREHGARFNEWFKDRVVRSTDGPSEILQRLARGPSWDVDTWHGWVNIRTGVKVDKEGFTLVDLAKVGYADEPFVLTKQVEQIFYIKDPANKKMHIVRDGKRRIVGVDNIVDEEEYNKNLHVRPQIDLDDDPKDEVAYDHIDLVPQEEEEEAWRQFKESFRYPTEAEAGLKRQTIRKMGNCWKNFKTTLVMEYVLNPAQPKPFGKYPFITRPMWDEFHASKSTKESRAKSQAYRDLQARNLHPHRLGTGGYAGKQSE